MRARVVVNKHFHFPAQAREVVMIANGTGIAPFLGMINQNTKNVTCYLYCGFREQASYTAYQDLLLESKATARLKQHHIAFSREGKKQYVSDLIKNDATFVADVLERGGVIMICGSLAMQKDVMELLETITQEKMDKSVSYYRSRDQIRTDCY
jgi:sulfite reductase (NADPH) flavoprotein alpha-component